MSNRLQVAVWDSPRITSPTDTAVAVALADRADEDGWCYPSIPTLAKKCRLTDRAVQLALRRLADLGVLHKEPHPTRRTNHFRLLVDALQSPLPAGDGALPGEGEPGSPYGEGRSPMGESGSPPMVNDVHPYGEPGSPDTSVIPQESPQGSVTDQPGGREDANEPASRLTDALVSDPDACDEEAFLSLAVRCCNRGMIDNPHLGESANPIPQGHGSREEVRRWLRKGAPRRVILVAVYHAAKNYRPNGRRQITTMAYFGGAVGQAAERDAAGKTAIPVPPVPGSQAEFVLRDPKREMPGAGRGREQEPEDPDAPRINAWLAANPDEAQRLWREEEAEVLKMSGHSAKAPFTKALVLQRQRQRVLNLLNGSAFPQGNGGAL